MRETWTWPLGAAFSVLLLVGAAQADYRLGPSDGVRIKVRDWPDLAGDYTVNPEGKLSLPIIGEVTAGGLSAGGLAKAISEVIGQTTGGQEKSVAAVEIIRFRPFFVTGDVQRPGEFVYRPGLTVLQAVSMAGGYYRPASSSLLRTERDVATASGDLETHGLRLLRSAARASRLEAGLSGKDQISFPNEVLDRKEEAAVTTLIENEKAILALERRRGAEEAQSLESIRALYQREIASLRSQAEALKREQDAVQRQLAELKSLSTRGLALTPNIITLERTLAQNQNEQLGMSTAIVRAQQNIELAEQKQRDQNAERRRQQASELQDARNDISDARARLATAKELIEEALTTERMEGRNPGVEIMQRRPVILVRRQGADVRESPAEDSLVLQPDDVLKVMPLPPRRLLPKADNQSPVQREARSTGN